ncbi:family 10 glycosylhydrolase [Paenibacillus sp. sgz500958]|uniref:family 10 glycosylhydrolase n=1 Tax=Paenibacillus sp. sgz500958 TaxID=3242475 RepID=UPI0036D3822A
MIYRKWIAGLLLFVLCLPILSPNARAAGDAITIDLNGTALQGDVDPYIVSRITMVPLGLISKGLGADVAWDQAAKTVTITKNKTELKLTSGEKTAMVNGASEGLDRSVEIKAGRIMVPIRFVSQQLGLDVIWNQAAMHISLKTKASVNQPTTPTIPNVPNPSAPTLPSVPGVKTGKAMKGVWIATLSGMDWPSTGSAGKIEQQKASFISMLDKLKDIGYNAVFVQVRPSGDSLYPSELVPWAEVLTGVSGKNPGYDPLQFMIAAAHERGMQFHAWFNPFRATTKTKAEDLAALPANHVYKQHPEWIVNANGKYYINPGIPAARQHIIDVVLEVVRNYDVDGIHMDDYFYPANVAFADDAAYKTYNSNGITNKADWRRDNLNNFIREMGEQVHAEKPQLSYGISPFGVWRNIKDDSTGSDTTAGTPTYDTMYADVRTWIKQGWIDYVAPQIYWSLSFKAARYDTLVDWWVKEVQNTGVKLYIGQAAYKVGDSLQAAEWQSGEQIISQLKYNEKYAEVNGSIMFRVNNIIGKDPFGLAGLLSFYFKS